MKKKERIKEESYDAFISYRHNSVGFYMAQVIYDRLLQNGYSVYMDKRLEYGEFEPQLEKAIHNSRNFILVLFPGDLDTCDEKDDWLRKEAGWAEETPNINFIPVFCEDFDPAKVKVELPQCLKKVRLDHAIKVHKDHSLDTDLDKLCNIAMKNTNPVKPRINTVDFFRSNLNTKGHLSVKSIDMAFHAGAAWLRPGHQKDILDTILERKIPTRVLVNTPEAAESIAKHMRDEYALYFPFEQVVKLWGKYAADYSDFLQVRVCEVPLLRVYHNIKFRESKENTFDRMHLKYYIYQNTNLENSFEHELSSFSKYYELYQNEFEFLWNASKPL